MTIIINDEDMKVIKAVSEKFTNVNSYKKESEELTPEQKEFIYERRLRRWQDLSDSKRHPDNTLGLRGYRNVRMLL